MDIIGIGSDIVECLRIAQMIERHGELFLSRVFTADEIAFCSSRKTATQHYAGRWAAKEAVLKAIGPAGQGIRWLDIEVRRAEDGTQSVELSGAVRDKAEQRGISDVLISISHCRTHATAHVVAVG